MSRGSTGAIHYTYQATSGDGDVVTGSVQADSERDALQQLQRNGLLALEVRQADPKGGGGGRKVRVTTALRLQAVQELATLLQSGVPVSEALHSLVQGHSQTALGPVFDALYARLRRGESLTQALSDSELDLPMHVLQMIRAGEGGGELATAFERALEQLTYMDATRQEIRSALVYPMVLVVTGLLSVTLIFTIVVPKFASLLSQGGDKVPLLSRIVLQTGMFLNENWPLMVLFFAVLTALIIAGVKTPAMYVKAEHYLLHVPVLGEWMRQIHMGRWTQSLGALLASKVALDQAMALSLDAVGMVSLRRRLARVKAKVSGGDRLTDALVAQRLMDPIEANLLRVGEHSSTLSQMLLALSQRYHTAARQRMKRFLSLLEPISILLIGAAIGILMVAIMLAITSVNDIAL